MSGRITDCNLMFVQMLGYKRSELLEMFYTDITPQEWHETEQKIITEDVLTRGYSEIYEKEYRSKDGTIIPVELRTFLFRNDKQENEGMWAIVRDISERKKVEKSLSENELKYRIIADNTYDWEFWVDASSRFLYCSPSCYRITGYTSDEFMSSPSLILNIIHVDDRASYTSHLIESKTNQQASEILFRIIHRDGTEYWISHVCHPIYDEKGLAIGRRGSNRDITVRMKTIEELRRSEARFKSYFELSAAGIAITSPAMNWIEVNECMCRILGYSRQELIKLTWAELTHPEDLNLDLDQFNKVLSGELDGYSLDKRFIHKNGNTVWTSLSVKCVRLKSGEVEYFMGILLDITDRKQIEVKLAWEQYFMNSLLDNIPDYIYFKDSESRFLRINKALSDVFQLEDPLLAIGKSNIDFLKSEQSLESIRDEQEIIKTGLPLIGKEEMEMWPDRPSTWVSSTKMPLFDPNGEIIGTFGISRDITEKKRIMDDLIYAKEKAEESDRLKTAFLQNISHEIRTPLNAILGFSELLGKPGLSINRKQEFISIINASNEQLLSIISGVIAAATLESGQDSIIEKETNLNHLIKKVYEQLEFNRNYSEVKFIFQPGLPDELANVNTDPVKLMQIMLNLVENALKFTHKGYVKFGYSQFESGLKFFVEDTGIGIPEEMHEHIFKRFTQLDNTATRKYGGTGLGLALAKGYTQLLGGNISLISKPGEGTTFFVIIPYNPISNVRPAHAEKNPLSAYKN
jgi:two-component system sensor histidine kinase/response regulator